MGIYTIVNTLSGKAYVGSTNNLAVRRARHWRDLRDGKHRNGYLQAAYDAHGREVFEFRVLEVVATADLLIAREQAWIDTLSACVRATGYNLIRLAERRQHSEATRLRMSASHTGKKFTPEHCARIGTANKGRPPSPCSAETRAKLSALMKSRPVSPDTRAKVAAAQKGRPGKPNSPDTRAKISAANKGRPKSAEHREKIGAAQRGRSLPPEQRERLAALQRNRRPETRAKLSEANGKLTNAQVREIRERAAVGERTRSLANAFNVSHSSISDIVRCKTYRHLLPQ